MNMSRVFYNSILFWLFLLLVVCLSQFSFALKSDESQPVEITADSATADQKNMASVFSGNVVITKGSLTVHADKGTASQDANGNRILTLYGSPVTFAQLQDDGQKVVGQGNKFVYNSKSSLAVLTGRARVQKNKNTVMGDTLTYNTSTQVYSATSGIANGVTHQSGGRITVILDQESASGSKKITNDPAAKPKSKRILPGNSNVSSQGESAHAR